MLKPFNISLNVVRNLRNKTYKWNDGIKYHGFTYYPRRPDFKDPPYEPTKLFQVKRIKPLKGLPYWEKHMLKEMGLDQKLSDIAIVKNIPENNARLWKIKHLIEITPITFPNGFPDGKSATLLKENGELIVKHINIPEERIEALDKFQKEVKRMDGDTLRRQSRLKWLSGWSLVM